jgi:hypothetical protein
VATPTLTVHFRAKACGHALSEAMREFERASPQNDPLWLHYFNESELSAELGHCLRDLGRAGDTVQHVGSALGGRGKFVRSDFFVSLVLADAYLAAGTSSRHATWSFMPLPLASRSGRPGA